MEPIPETTRAVDELSHFGGTKLMQRLRAASDQVKALVPECVGLSLAYLESGVALTLVATDEDIAMLDAVQYVSGGPCVDGALDREVLEFNSDDLIDEDSWLHFAQATAAASIQATLTLPIIAKDTVVGSVNLYAASPNAFAGLHGQIAEIFNAWAPGAVMNADLTFRTRAAAEATPQRLTDDKHLDMAVGILMARHFLDADEARDRLQDAARRAGVSEAALVAGIIESIRERHAGEG
jgi:GAF domain-containing protein